MSEREKRSPEQPRYKEFPEIPKLTPVLLLPEEKDNLERLHGITSTGEFFAQVDKNAKKITKRFIPAGIDRERALKVIDCKDFSDVAPTDQGYYGLLEVALTKAGIERQIIRSTIKEKKDSLNLTATERTVLADSLDIQDQYDKLYWQWIQNIITSPLGLKLKKLKEQDKKAPKAYLKEHGAEIPEHDYAYVTFNQHKEDGKIETVPYALAFPEPIAKINHITSRLIENLKNIKPIDENEKKERDGFIRYYDAFKLAHVCVDPQQLEEKFKNLDEVWFEVSGRMQPIHMIEVYSDPADIRVEPEFELAILDDKQSHLNALANKAKISVINFLERDFGDKKSFAPSKKPMSASIAGIYSILAAGSSVDKPFSGKNAPNRTDVRLHRGVKIFENPERMKEVEGIYQDSLNKVFGVDYAKQHFTTMDKFTNFFASVHVPGHEVAHNFLIQEKTKQVLGTEIVEQIEEHKADMAGTLVAQELLDFPDLQIATQALLAWSLRMLARRDDDSYKPYYDLSQTYIKTMHETGVLVEKDNHTGFTYNQKPEKINSFYAKTRIIFTELAEVYDTLDRGLAKKFINKYYAEEPQFILDLHAKLGLKPRETTVFQK